MEQIDEDRVGEFDNQYSGDQAERIAELEQDVVDDRHNFQPVNSRDNDSFNFRPQHNITGLDNNSFSGDTDITPPQHNTETNVEQSEGDEDISEEESVATQAAGDRSGGIAGSRKARTRWWPPQSNSHQTYPSLQQRKAEIGEQVITLGRGQNSGRNRLAIFKDADNIPRLAFNIRVEGRTGIQWKGYPSPKERGLPVGASLSEILAHYPNHVWNDGLRLFMAEGWQAETMWNVLPKDARNEGANTRKWNYLQQALGREADKIGQEQFGEKRVPDKRSKKDEPDSDIDGDNNEDVDNYDNSFVNSAAVYTNSSVGGSRTAPQGFPSNNAHIMTSYAPGFSFNPPSQNIAAPGVGRGQGRGRGRGSAGGDGNLATTQRGGPTGLARPDLVN